LQEVSEKHGGSADEGLSIVGLDLGGHPLIDTKRAKAAINFSVVKSDVGSRWMAFVKNQTKTSTYPFVMRQALPV